MVSFAGGRFSARSAQSLFEGQTFRAQISLAANGVQLKILSSEQAGGGQNFVQAFSAQGQETADFLAALGLPPDNLSGRILQFLTQSERRIDARLMQKVRRLAQKFKGREIEAAEAALVLEEKGIDSEAALDLIMAALEQGAEDGKNGGAFEDDENDLPERDEIALEVKRFFLDSLLSAKTEPGALALFNHLRSSKENGGKTWTLFPFEYKIAAQGSQRGEEGRGVLRLFLDVEKSSLEKLVINFKSGSANLFFAVYFEGKAVRRLVLSCDDKKTLDGMDESLLESLSESFGGVDVELADGEEFSKFGAENLPLFSVEGFA